MSAGAALAAINPELQYTSVPAPGDWTAVTVRARLEAAAETLRRLPRGGPSARLCGSWPAIVRGVWDHAQAHPRHRPLLRPDPAAIDAMDEALHWLFWVEDARYRTVCFARAAGVGATRLSAELGCDRKTIARWRAAAESIIAQNLNDRA